MLLLLLTYILGVATTEPVKSAASLAMTLIIMKRDPADQGIMGALEVYLMRMYIEELLSSHLIIVRLKFNLVKEFMTQGNAKGLDL